LVAALLLIVIVLLNCFVDFILPERYPFNNNYTTLMAGQPPAARASMGLMMTAAVCQ
jgi:hypothetical protein